MSRRSNLEYAKLALVASDQAYFDNSVEYQESHIRNAKQYPYLHLNKGDALAALADVPRNGQGYVEDVHYRNTKNPFQTNEQLYQNAPPFAVPQGFKVEETIVRDNSGAKAVIYRNATTNEIIVAFGGTDGPNAQDHAQNSQTYGFSQWTALNKPPDPNNQDKNYLDNPKNMGVIARLDELKEKYGTGNIIFTGQSLGGALAQYAVAEYIVRQYKIAKSLHAEYIPSNLHLYTYNGLGGKDAFEQNIFNDTNLANQDRQSIRDKLNHLGSATHYVVDNDFVSKLGGGHIGSKGEVVMLDWKYLVGPHKGRPMDIADAHRIETAFYTHLSADAHELQKGRTVKEDSRDFQLIHTPNATNWANKIASFGNGNGDMTSDEAIYRLITGLAAGHFAAPKEVNTVVKEVLNTQFRAGMSEVSFQGLNALNDFYNSPGDAKSIAATTPFMPQKLSLEAATAIAMTATSIAAWGADRRTELVDRDPDFIDGYRYLPKGEGNGIGGIGDGRWYRNPPSPPIDNAWSNPATPSKQIELDAIRAFRLNKQFKAPVSEDAMHFAANTAIKPAANMAVSTETHTPLTEAQIIANLKSKRSPDGKEPLGQWIQDGPNQGHSWYQAKDGTVQRVALTVFQGGNSLIVTDYAKGSITPKQEQHTIRGADGEILANLMVKPNARGQMEGTLIDATGRPLIDKDKLPVPRVSQLEEPVNQAKAEIQFANYGQIAASKATAMKIAQDIPEKYRDYLQQTVDAMIAKHNLTVDVNQAVVSAESSLA